MNRHPGSTGKLIALCLGALALACGLSSVPPSKAKHGSRATTHGKEVNASGRWQVLAPVAYKNLTLFPIRAAHGAGAAAARASNDYITLDEGIRNGTVEITERGSSGHGGGGTQAAGRGRGRGRNGRLRGMVNRLTSGDADSVNQLALVNRSGRKLLLLAGEVITGGNQDRIVEEDLIIPPVSVPVSLNVFCVEPGRWQQRSAGASSGSAPSSAASIQQTAEPAIVSPAVKPSESFSSLGAISHPKLRAVAQDRKDQSSVWDEVRANNAKLGTTTSTETYKEVYDKPEVGDQMRAYVSAFEREVPGRGIVGVVVARGGELVWVDCFASETLFEKYWPKLLKSYIVDALGEARTAKRPTVEQAQDYLQARPPVKPDTRVEPGIYSLAKIANAQSAIFELHDISMTTPLLLHFNKMER